MALSFRISPLPFEWPLCRRGERLGREADERLTRGYSKLSDPIRDELKPGMSSAGLSEVRLTLNILPIFMRRRFVRGDGGGAGPERDKEDVGETSTTGVERGGVGEGDWLCSAEDVGCLVPSRLGVEPGRLEVTVWESPATSLLTRSQVGIFP